MLILRFIIYDSITIWCWLLCCSETGSAVQLHFRRPHFGLGARVVFTRLRRRHHSTFRSGGVRLRRPVGRRRWTGHGGRRELRGGRRRAGAVHAGQHNGRQARLHAPAAVAVGRAPIGRVRIQRARHQRPHVADSLHTQLGRQANDFRYVSADVPIGNTAIDLF